MFVPFPVDCGQVREVQRAISSGRPLGIAIIGGGALHMLLGPEYAVTRTASRMPPSSPAHLRHCARIHKRQEATKDRTTLMSYGTIDPHKLNPVEQDDDLIAKIRALVQ